MSVLFSPLSLFSIIVSAPLASLASLVSLASLSLLSRVLSPYLPPPPSLKVGIDRHRRSIVVGTIDYFHKFDLRKRIESVAKGGALAGQVRKDERNNLFIPGIMTV
jgi:hypothetical protein